MTTLPFWLLLDKTASFQHFESLLGKGGDNLHRATRELLHLVLQHARQDSKVAVLCRLVSQTEAFRTELPPSSKLRSSPDPGPPPAPSQQPRGQAPPSPPPTPTTSGDPSPKVLEEAPAQPLAKRVQVATRSIGVQCELQEPEPLTQPAPPTQTVPATSRKRPRAASPSGKKPVARQTSPPPKARQTRSTTRISDPPSSSSITYIQGQQLIKYDLELARIVCLGQRQNWLWFRFRARYLNPNAVKHLPDGFLALDTIYDKLFSLSPADNPLFALKSSAEENTHAVELAMQAISLL